MAKGTKAGAILVKLVSTAATGYFYVRVSERSATSWKRMTLFFMSDRLDSLRQTLHVRRILL